MKNFELSLPLKQQELIKLNNYPKKNPHKDFDPTLESKIPKNLYTPLTEISNIKLMEKVINLTCKDKKTKEKAETASWLRKFTFEEPTETGSKAKILSQIKKPIDYHDFFQKSFIEVEENLENLKAIDLKPGNKKYMLFDVDEENFKVKSMKNDVLGYPSKIVIEKDGVKSVYTSIANNMTDYYLIEVGENEAFYYPLQNSLKLKKAAKKNKFID